MFIHASMLRHTIAKILLRYDIYYDAQVMMEVKFKKVAIVK